ncbi:FHA domain-containing protein [Geobacter sp. OR-1]|uniref:FHA domain-containing protein n=1 Tax=Geobacter sp. OR-1 TaxID=1266765 RepID=UPI00126A5690|nr:FHA domain-containing protein [Geobacter sp. OR-1]
MKLQPAIVAELVHIHGPMKGSILECSDERISIGRHPSCTIQFPPELTSISRKHAEIIREGNRFKLVDYSTNGTFVNGRKVTEAFLKDGDVLEFSAGGPKVSFLSRETDQPAVPTSGRQSPAGVAVIQVDPQAPDAEPVPAIPNSEPFPEKRPLVDAEPAPRVPSPIAPAVAAEKVSAPLVIQFGPSIRSFSVLPIVIGSGPGADFVIPDHALLPQHVQIRFFPG